MQKISLYTGSLYQAKLIDNEWLNIIKRLKSYGYSSTGTKPGDYALLKKLENTRSEQNYNASNLQTKVLSEKQAVKDKKEIKTEKSADNRLNLLEAADLLGEQLFLTVKMKEKINYKY